MKALVWIFAVLTVPQALYAADGKLVFERNCGVCHDGWGGYGAPGIGNFDVWKKAFRSGERSMLKAVIEGRNSMPAKGGNPTLSEDDVRAAVRYIVEMVDGADSKILAAQ
jgi:cytochrome c5